MFDVGICFLQIKTPYEWGFKFSPSLQKEKKNPESSIFPTEHPLAIIILWNIVYDEKPGLIRTLSGAIFTYTPRPLK